MPTYKNIILGLKIKTVDSLSVAAVFFFYSFFTAVISTSILSHTILFHVFVCTYVVKMVTRRIL